MSFLEILGLVALVGLVAATVTGLAVARRARAKLEKLHTRFLWVEDSNAQLGRYVGQGLAAAQRKMGAATFTAPNAASPFDGAGRWECLGGAAGCGGWEPYQSKRARGLAVLDGRLYVGLESRHAGNAGVWVHEGDAWRQIGGGGRKNSWDRADEVVCLDTYDGALIAGTASADDGAAVWRYDGNRWTCIGGGATGAWPDGLYQVAQCLAVHDGRLYAGLWSRKDNARKDGAVFAWDGGHWSRIGAPGQWGGDGPEEGIYQMFSHGDGALYAGAGGGPGAGRVWRLSGESWEPVATGADDGWDETRNDYMLAFASYRGCLIASTERVPSVAGDFSTVWARQDGRWRPVGPNHVPPAWGRLHSFNALAVYGDRLIVGAGGAPAGKASLWELDDSQVWRQVAGDGRNGSWGSADRLAPMSHRTAREYIYKIIEHGGDLIVGFGAGVGMAQVWRYRPPAAHGAA